ncbi:MAG: aminoglycoside phosphotransferase family protein [Acidimicrobiia bacterium]|nr:aminoglycoside phosphotransferase family protein [Acidimicrobiia bacterium]
MALHENEFPVNDDLVHRLLFEQVPQWSDLPLERLATSGTVNVIYRLGDDKVVRLPRAPHLGSGPEREARWMPVFAAHLPLTVPRFLALGEPTEWYPSYWTVLEWIDGMTASASTLDDLDAAAVALGEFACALRTVPTAGAPAGGNYRGFGLGKADPDFRLWVAELPADIDRSAATRVWESCLAVGDRTDPPTWFHSDLRGDNLIVQDGRLCAVIDWEGCTVGDPSADLLAAWWLFDGDSRETFRSASQAGADDWKRAKGWAVYMAVAAIPYYAATNQIFAEQAQRALGEILADD